MASLSLPRVLQLKRNTLDAERDHFEKFQSLAISKAINSQETPVKEKHVRSAIIGSFQEQGAVTYWVVAIRQPLQDNRISAWKFCHVTHKLLREGHPACLDDSQRHIGMIENLGKLWVHLREGYGKLISLYTALLACKLRFHARNPQFPGNMAVTSDELDAIAENDVNNYFQLCVELFDYMDDILNLQATVFDSLGNARANSMTASGQCRLAALIPCAQDSSHIYDCNVRLLFRLHAALPPDTLAGHRERFRQQFKKLSAFYKHASTMQYFRNLLTLPQLPANPPNFLLQSDFGTYVAPVVMIPEPQPEEPDAIGLLIDTTDTMSQIMSPQGLDDTDSRTTPSPQPDLVVERDRLIEHLQSELKRYRSEITQLLEERSSMLGSMREHCGKLEAELEHTKADLRQEREKAEQLTAQTPEITQKLSETEERARVTDEKFQKLKGAYTQLREEHIGLLRQKADVDKMASSLRAAAAEHESAKVVLQEQLNGRSRDMEHLQQSASNSEAITSELESLRTEITNLRTELETSKHKEQELLTSIEDLQQQHKTTTSEAQEQIVRIEEHTKELTTTLEKTREEKVEKEVELVRLRDEIALLRDKSGEEFTRVVEEKEEALKQVAALGEQIRKEKQDTGHKIELLENNIREHEEREMQHKDNISELNKEINTKCNELETLIDSKEAAEINLNNQLTDLQLNLNLKEQELEILNKTLLKTIEEQEHTSENISHEINANATKANNLQIELENYKENMKSKAEEVDTIGKRHEKALNETEQLRDSMKQQLQTKSIQINDLQETLKAKDEDLISNDKDIETLKNELEIKEWKYGNMKQELEKKDDEITTLQERETYYKHELNTNAEEITKIKETLLKLQVEKENNDAIMKEELEEKSEKLNSLDSVIKSLSEVLEYSKNEMIEREAELEITRNELLSLKSGHEDYVDQSEKEQIEALRLNKELVDSEMEKEILRSQIVDLEKVLKERDAAVSKYDTAFQQTEEELKSKIIEQINSNKVYELKISHTNAQIADLMNRAQILDIEKCDAIESKEVLLKEYEQQAKYWESKLEYSEKERLTAECELQDLLQHNTSLEENLSTVKLELQQAKGELEKQRASVVQCAAQASLELISGALASLERASAQESGAAAGELAARALADLAAGTQIGDNGPAVARSAISAAHHAAQLATHTSEALTTVTDMELADKLTGDCRTMLNTTRACMEALAAGEPPEASASDARRQVGGLVEQGRAAATGRAAFCVDDELADMDRAIEEAAGRIEEILAASRAADSGLKLEVNNKILDACTTLMGAVKVLVQDARKLQNELGDPKTRQKMYRRNPQWSEGLISAAKAVVVAAKLLVTSADEAVCGSGAIEGVSAASHEVAGSTAQLVAASRARAPPGSPALAALAHASRDVAAATGAVVAAVRAAGALYRDQEDLETSALTLTAARRLEMESKVRSLELESALDAERARLAVLRRRHYQLAQQEENGNLTNGRH